MFRKTLQNIRHPYTIEVSARARYMRLRVSLQKGVVVVVPRTMSKKQVQKQVPDFVREQQQWIDRVLEKLQAENTQTTSVKDCVLPEHIQLKALGQCFKVSYHPLVDNDTLSLSQSSDFELIIKGDIENKQAVFQLFEQFFKTYAYHFIQLRLDKYSQQFNLPYQRLTVRAQKTRWGSCSSKRNINLNYRLIFLPEHLLDYVVLHELAHIRHMNHSKCFWALLESMAENARGQDRQLNQAAKKLPEWVTLTY